MSRAYNPLIPFVGKVLRRSILTVEQQEAILALPARVEQIAAHVDFVRLGDITEHACLIVHGLAARFGQSQEGNRQITALHIPGDMADLHSVVSPAATSALQTLCTSTVVRVPHSAIREIAARHPAIAQAFWRECVVDAAVLSEWVVNIGRRGAAVRLAHLYCEMAYRYALGAPAEAFTFDFPATQHHLADALGLTAVHINRTARALESEGLVQLRRGVVEVPSWSALTRFADFDPAYLQLDVAPLEPM